MEAGPIENKVNTEIRIKVITHQITHSAGNMRGSWRVDNALRKQAFACNRTCGIV
jgi:predicted metallopeptidase